ncbi:MAG: hypothetical protein IT536_06810 [Hyphomicrobiales bacterium]|nr:hypothetical protein [Hyphomicrobiales bacterium]
MIAPRRFLSVLLGFALGFAVLGPLPAPAVAEPAMPSGPIGASGAAPMLAQNKVRTETIRPPASGAQKYRNEGHVAPPEAAAGTLPEIVTDPARLPPAVARTRERILAAARSGDLARLHGVMKEAPVLPVFSFSEDRDPIAFWKANYPDSEGIEALAILINVLETAFVHVDVGTPQEIYLWPYFARLPLKALTPAQKVELFRIVTGADYKDMVEFGVSSFYRVGIAPDGSWQFFVAGD